MLQAFIQAVVSGLMTGAMIALPAIGFTTIFAVLRYPSFTIAAYMTIGGFAALYAGQHIGWSLLPLLAVAAIVSAVVGLVVEQGALSPLRKAGALTTAIGSIALNLVLENAVRFGFGNDLQGFDLPIYPDLRIADIRVGGQQLQNLGVAIAVMAAVFAFLRFSRFGRAMRAVADNPDLARLKSIDPRVISAVAIAMGAAMAGIGGTLLGMDTSVDPLMGYRVLLSVFAAAVLGGLGSIPGAVVGALAIGVAEEVALLAVPATYRGAVAFFAILVMLTFRPRGLLGERSA
jgi:branched-subunit amino acid ABC-type transport system permease component